MIVLFNMKYQSQSVFFPKHNDSVFTSTVKILVVKEQSHIYSALAIAIKELLNLKKREIILHRPYIKVSLVMTFNIPGDCTLIRITASSCSRLVRYSLKNRSSRHILLLGGVFIYPRDFIAYHRTLKKIIFLSTDILCIILLHVSR